MGERKITTRLVIDGEAQYKAAMSAINAENKLLASSLKLVESEYKGNANSIDALTAKGKVLAEMEANQAKKVAEATAAMKNAEGAVKVYEQRRGELAAKIRENEQALEKLKQAEGDTAEEQKKLTEETARLKQEYDENEKKITAAEKGVTAWKTTVNNAKTDLNNLNGEIEKNDRYLDEAKASADGCATSIDRFGKEAKDAGDDAEKFGKKTKDGVDSVGAALLAAGIEKTLAKIVEAMKACASASIDFESAMAGVAKTTDLTETELSQMGEAIKGMAGEIPMAATEIAGITETAGQLGISGKKDLLEFTETMAMLGTATNMTADDAATMLAQFANITGMDTDSYSNLGSAITALGNTSATTESKIVDMSQGVAAAANLAGMSESDIVALAAAVTSLGIETQAGSTAMSKLISDINMAVATGDGLDKWASVAGMTAQQFATAWGQNAAGALNSFIVGLNDTERNGKSAEAVLKDLGITETRQTRMTLSLAGAGDLLSKSLATSSKAFKENTALTKEAQTRYDTTESKLQLLKNAFTNVKTAVGDQLNPALENLTETGTEVLEWLADFIEENEWVGPVLMGVAVAFGILAVAVAGFGIATRVVIPAIEAMNEALNKNPILLIISLVAGLVTALAALAASYDDGVISAKEMTVASRAAAEELGEINKRFDENDKAGIAAAATAREYVRMLEDLEKQGLKTNEQQNQYKILVDMLNEAMPELNVTISEQTGLIEGGTASLLTNIDAWEKYYRQQAMMEKYGDLLKEQAAVEWEVAENRIKSTQASKDLEAAQATLSAAEEKHQSILDDTSRSLIEKNGELVEAQKEIGAAEQEVRRLTEQEAECEKAITSGTDTLKEYDDAVGLANETMASFNAEQAAMGEGGVILTEKQQGVQASIQQLGTEINNLAAAYEVAYNSAYESISGQVGLWDEFSAGVETSAGKMTATWDQQTSAINEYADNLVKAGQYGIADGLVAQLSEGSAESAEHLQAIINQIENLGASEEGMSEDAEEFVTGFNESYSKTEEAKEKFANVVAGMETDFDAKMTSIGARLDTAIEDMNRAEEAAAAAADTGQSYASGLLDQMDAVYNAGAALASQANKGWKDFYVQHSPAKLAINTARDTGESYAMGLEMEIDKVEKAGRELAKASNTAFAEEMTDRLTAAMPRTYDLPQKDYSGPLAAILAAIRENGKPNPNAGQPRRFNKYDVAEALDILLGQQL